MLRYQLEARELDAVWMPRLSVEPGPVQDVEVRTRHDGFEGQAHVLVLDGMTLVRGRHRSAHALTLQGHEEAPEVALHIGLRGAPTAMTDGLDGYLSHQPHQLELIHSPSPRTSFALEAGADNEAFEVNFSLPRFEAWAAQQPALLGPLVERVQRGEPFRLQATVPWSISHLLEVLDEIMDSRRFGSLRPLFLETKVLEFLLLLRAAGPAAPRPGAIDGDRMLAAREHLLANLRRPPTTEALARLLGTNAFQLKRDFRHTFGRSLYAFVLEARLELARRLVCQTTRPLKAIADEVGYRHPAHFTAAFCQKFGVPPSKLRGAR
jgi:AraC family transcriptional activator of pyochelin receptor